MKKLPLFLLLVLTVVISCTNPITSTNQHENTIVSVSKYTTIIFSSEDDVENMIWLKDHVSEIENGIPIIKKDGIYSARACDEDNDGEHDIQWTKKYFTARRWVGNGYNISKYRFGYCRKYNCDYTELELVDSYFEP